MNIQKPLGLRGPEGVRGRADVVFVVDSSGSMMGVINDLKARLADFVTGVESDKQVSVDWRVASLGQDTSRFVINGFSEDPSEFAAGLARITAGGDEYTLPAIDWAADMTWRENSHRFIVVLSDEKVETGSRVDWQVEKLEQLMDKLDALHVKLMIFAPESQAFGKMAGYSGVTYKTISSHSELLSAELGELLKFIGATVSTAVSKGIQQQSAPLEIPRDIYGLKGTIAEV